MKRGFWLLALVSTAAAAQYANQGYRWAPTDAGVPGFGMPFFVDTVTGAGIPTGVRPAVDAALAQWAAGDAGVCSWIKLGDVGASISPPLSTTDSVSVVPIWVQSEDDNYNFAFGGNPEVVSASIPYTFAGQVYACDIYLNAVDWAFTTQSPTPAGDIDLQTQVAYELGHCMGLGDSYASTADVMSAFPTPGVQRRALTDDDVSELCSYYPVHGYDGPCGGGSGACLGGQGLTCIHLDGGSASACSITCNVPAVGGPNPCPQPFVCISTNGGSAGYCSINSGAITLVGQQCDGGTVAVCGPSNSTCFYESWDGPLPSGVPAWPGGYCTQQDQGGNHCPQGSVSYPMPSGGPDNGGASANYCLKNCQLGGGECRPGYACSPLNGLDAGTGACVTACAADSDCGANAICRACDGVCLPKNTNPAAQIGDFCNYPGDCGVGQTCLTFSWGTGGVCAQPCSQQCGACPTGTQCLPAGSGGALYCLHSCSIGTCPSAEQCRPFPGGTGCATKCVFDNDCLNGERCGGGQCASLGQSDAGPCPLCYVAPTDSPPSSAGADAGINPVTSGGCGCQTSAGAAVIPLLFMALLLGARRRWPSN